MDKNAISSTRATANNNLYEEECGNTSLVCSALMTFDTEVRY